jgi:metal-responsive CopG/Arc/MetJ family transcriptional regulator
MLGKQIPNDETPVNDVRRSLRIYLKPSLLTEMDRRRGDKMSRSDWIELVIRVYLHDR